MSETLTHGDVTYRVIALERCLPLVEGLVAAGRKWHSHVLSPGCAFNPYDRRYAIVVEDDAGHIAYIAPSDGFPEVDKTFVKMLHGDDILDEHAARAADPAEAAGSALLARLRGIDAQGVHWHHHMNFPACALNPHRGRWAITVESENGTFSESYDAEPKAVLREIEVLYFRNLAARTAAG
ncbi:hypothetical protein KHC23_06210 [Ancylobacter dichloromethanicus]|uniref:Uncharacterized protein n=1 Tax=Ancylobacter dichloromethanicus TaxID=518825 RepID=A0A9W6JBL6_9HYPH|nr:hypothetical protein [Ancylobacter dichloromethanicus]MBS7553239.1 hypothetical protein [Ancylobacter dichloromethanicus]GLK73019.1 hypothetical protein GCM10017643_31350 [Ancylobacter dichloromethanicus]